MRNMAWLVCLLLLATAARGAEPLKVCLVSGSAEYRSDDTLAAFKPWLENGFNAQCELIKAVGADALPGLDALDRCDVALFFTRRITISGEDLEKVKKYCLSGKPIVAVRTASHGFQNWLDFDKIVLGGNYNNHDPEGPTQRLLLKDKAKSHPIFAGGIPALASRASLYRTGPVADDCEVLLMAQSPKNMQPAAWTREVNGGRVFYISIGAPSDFESAGYRRVLANALFWTARREPDVKPVPPLPQRPQPTGSLNLMLRKRSLTVQKDCDCDEVTVEANLPVAETAILICDLWDKHWCRGATERVGKLAEKMNPVLKAARERGVQIIHAPSETMAFYFDLPQRRRVKDAPAAAKPEITTVHIEPPLPIDDKDGGCDTDDKQYMAWTRQHPGIEIGEFDGISDDGTEVYNFLKQRGIHHIIYMGVHTNMCVLGRSFAIRQMTKWGMNCYLARDLTDAMYDPNDAPHVPHDEGTQLVVKHIEKYWCPSLTSEDLMAALR